MCGEKRPKISVIIPVYRTEKYLSECVDSVLAQTFDALELILIDDGSPDSCPQICDDYLKRDNRVRVFHKENEGAAAARNVGLDAARGDYITFVDSDDYIDSMMYENMIRTIERYNCDFVVCDCVKEYEGYSQQYTHDVRGGYYNEEQFIKEYMPQLLILPSIEYPVTISNWVCLFRRELLEKPFIRYQSGIRFSEDWLFGAQAALKAKTFYYMKGENHYHYRMNEQSVTHTFKKDKWNDYCKLYDNIKKEFSKVEKYDFHVQINRVLLFLLYNVLDDLNKTKQLGIKEKVIKIKDIIKSSEVKRMFKQLNIWKQQISFKQKVLTMCYKRNIFIKEIVKYYARK